MLDKPHHGLKIMISKTSKVLKYIKLNPTCIFILKR